MSLIGGVIRNAQSHVALPFANACLTGTFDCASTDGYGIWNAAWGYEGVSVTASAGGYYEKAVNFTSADVAWYPAYGTYGYWKVIELDPKPPEPDSCFTGDTRVTMADGSTKPIADVSVGELVVGLNGAISRVVAIERPMLGERRLYAVNDSAPFFTAEHPFLTENGWGAIDPAATAAENAALPVRPLRVGTILRVARSVRVPATVGGVLDRAEMQLADVPVTALRAVEGDPWRVVYNLLLDGDHTYIANGFLVHNKGGH